MNTLKFIALALLLSTSLAAQKLEFGKVSKQELAEKSHPFDPEAAAAILFKKARTYFYYTENKGFQSETEYEIRLKIYKKEGFSWANYAIPYYIGWSEIGNDNVFFSDVTTYNLEHNKIEKTKLNAKGTFKEKINDYWMKKTITFPNVKEGSIIEFKYKLVSENLVKLPDFYFQEYIPVNYAEYKTEIPVNYNYKTILRGYSKVEHEAKDEMYTQAFNSANTQTKQLTYNIRKQKYTLKDIPALKEEPYVDNIENYRIKVENELNVVAFKDVQPKIYLETWDDVARNITQNEKFKKEIETKGYFEGVLLNNLSDTLDKLGKARVVFNHVKNRIKWNGEYGYYPKQGVKEAYLNRNGNVADINLNLVIMLRSAGLNAFPVLISTRKNGKTLFPSREGFNYLIAAANIEGNQVLMDATDLNADFNILPIRCLNGVGRSILYNGQSEEINVNPVSLSKSITFVQADLLPNGTLKGKVRSSKSDYHAYLFRDRFGDGNQNSYLEKLEEEYNNLDIEEYKVENLKELEKMIIETYSFSNSKVSDLSGDKIIFNPLLFFTKTINPFKQEKRTMPVDFVFPAQDKYTISIAVPKGYQIESLPKSTTVSLPDNGIFFSFNISGDQDKITISSFFDINRAVFESDYYEDLKNIFKIYIEKQTESIILKKS